MKMTINFSNFCDAFFNSGRKDQFSYNGKKALFEYIESLEQNTGEEMELDIVGLCCDFTEYENALEAAKNYSGFFTSEEDLSEGEEERQSLEFLSDRTTILQFDGGIIVQAF